MVFAKRWVRRPTHLSVLALPLLLATPVLGQEPTKEELKRKIQELQRQQCKEPEFRVEWFGPHGAVLIVKGEPERILSTVKIKTTSDKDLLERLKPHKGESAEDRKARFEALKESELEPLHTLFTLTNVKATKEGAQRNLRFDGEEGRRKVNRIYAQNGWVVIEYKSGTPCDTPCEMDGMIVTPIVERHKLSIDAGTVLVEEKNGSWKAQPEFAVATESRWWDYLTGYVDLRYSHIAASDDDPNEDDNGDGDDDDNGDGDDDGSMEVRNPFESGGGSLRGNLYMAVHPFRTPTFGLIGGGGFSTTPDSEELRAELRFFGGFRFEAFAYNVRKSPDFFGSTSGFIQFGYAWDELWEWDEGIAAPAGSTEPPTIRHRDERERIFLEGQLRLPDNGGAVTFSPRIYADFPVSGEGPSDVRISILAKVKLENLLGIFSGVQQ